MAPRCPPDVRAKAIHDLINGAGGVDQIKKAAQAIVDNADNPAGLNGAVRELNKPTFRGAMFQLWINGLLSSPKTHAVNILSNSLTAAWSVPERFLAAGISKVSGDGAIEFGEATAHAFGFAHGIRDGFRLLAHDLAESLPEGSLKKRFEIDGSDDILNQSFDAFSKIEGEHVNQVAGEAFGVDPSGALGKGIYYAGKTLSVPTSMLASEDKFFKAIGYRMELHALAYRQAAGEGLEGSEMAKRMHDIMSDPPDSIQADALDKAHYQTFTNSLGEMGQAGQRFLNNKKAWPLKFIVPFVRTPINIMKYTFERTPLGFASSRIRADLGAGGARGAQAQARMALGSMAMMVAGMGAAEGWITGRGPMDPRLRKIKMDSGWKPYSVKIGDRWFQYSRLDPIAMVMGLGADIAELAGEASDEDTEMIITAGAMAIAQNLASKTYMQGLMDFMGAVDPNNPANNIQKYLTKQAGTLMPYSSFLRNVTSGLDPVVRDVRTSAADAFAKENLEEASDPVAKFLTETVNGIYKQIPGLSDELPARKTLWGDDIDRSSGVGWAYDMLSPVPSKSDKPDPVNEMILDNKIKISHPSRVIEGVSLTGEEYARFVELAGKPAKEYLDQFVANGAFNQMSDGPDGMKAEVVKNIIGSFRKAARAQMLQEFPELRERVFERKSEQAGALAQ